MGLVLTVCPECKAQIKVDPSQKAAICPYCHKPFIVSDALCLSQSRPAETAQTIQFGQLFWRVRYSQDGGHAFLISEQAVCKKAFHDVFEGVTWENCSLREWLNTEFLNECFSRKERKAIETMKTLPADENPAYKYMRYKHSSDSVFLLSLYEANSFFKDAEDRACFCHNEPCFWWLRTPIIHDDFAAVVNYDGTINNEEGFIVNGTSGGVRPAVIIKTDHILR